MSEPTSGASHHVLLTGGTGFVGRAVAAALLKRGHAVRVLTRRFLPADDPLPAAGARICVGDFADPETIGAALKDISAVVHLAASLGGRDANQLRRVNVMGSEAIARAARERRIARFVHVSSAGVYGDRCGAAPHVETDVPAPRTPYELTKYEGEQAVRRMLDHGPTSWVICRPAGVYGGARPATRSFLREVRTRRLWIHLPPRVIVHPTYIEDVVQALIALLDRPEVTGEILNIGGERALPFDEWIELTASALGAGARQLVVASPPVGNVARAAAAAIKRLGMTPPERLVRAGLPIISRAVEYAKATRLIGYRPVPVGEGLRETVAAARDAGGPGERTESE